MMIVAQIKLHGFIGFGSLDVPFFEDMEFMSSDLGSVWWEPADGFVASAKTRFFDSVRFFDPGTSMEPDLYANGLHFSHGSHHLLVRNLTTSPLRVSGELYLSGSKSGKVITISAVQMPADSS